MFVSKNVVSCCEHIVWVSCYVVSMQLRRELRAGSSVYGLDPDSSIVSGLCTISSAAMIDLDVRAAERPSNVIPRSAAHARQGLPLFYQVMAWPVGP
jgi:hypothetical protein